MRISGNCINNGLEMSSRRVKILGVPYDNITRLDAIKRLCSILSCQNKSLILFLNVDCLKKAAQDEEYRYILNKADLVLSDGIGLKIASRLFGERMKENCNGTDLSPLILGLAAKRGHKIFLLGGKEGIAQKATENVKSDFPGVQIIGYHHGFFDNDEDIIQKINSSAADILFVATGVPKQEKWIYRNRDKLNPKVYLGVGALFDYLSWAIPRAPLGMRKVHLEWLWRIMINPKRMFKRYIIDDMSFLVYLVYYRLFRYRKENTYGKMKEE